MKPVIIAILALSVATSYGLTDKERKLVESALTQVRQGVFENTNLRLELGAAREANTQAAMSTAKTAAKALVAEAAAQKEHDELVRSERENREMRPIVAAVSGPWWFPGGRALLYGAKKSAISAVVIIVGAFVLFLIIKIVLTVVTGGTWSAGLGAATGIFGKLGRWFGRAGKRLLSFLRRRGKTAVDNIEHRTIGSEPEDTT